MDFMKETEAVTQELDQKLDGLLGKMARGKADDVDLARYDELTIARMKAGHYTREMAMAARRRENAA